jgi:hypothetical protein
MFTVVMIPLDTVNSVMPVLGHKLTLIMVIAISTTIIGIVVLCVLSVSGQPLPDKGGYIPDPIFLIAPFNPPWFEDVVPASAEVGPLALAEPWGAMPPEMEALAVALVTFPVARTLACISGVTQIRESKAVRTRCVFGMSTFQSTGWRTGSMAVTGDLLRECSCIVMTHALLVGHARIP